MDHNELNNKIIRLIKLFRSWGLKESDWIITDKFVQKGNLADFALSLNSHIIVKSDKLPWQVNIGDKGKKQVIPPVDTVYLKQYIDYIENDLHIEIAAVDKKIFFGYLKYSEKIKIKEQYDFLQLTPLFHVLRLSDRLEFNKQAKIYNAYARLLNLKKELFVYAKTIGDEKILNELKLLHENRVIKKKIKGQTVNDIKVSGKVKLVFHCSGDLVINKDDIIVAKATNVKWLPVIIKAKGIIAQKGGLSSHTAITCRELKIPCIVGVDEALFEYCDGDVVKIIPEENVVKLVKPVKNNFK